MNSENKIEYKVLGVKNETENIFTLSLETPDGAPLSFLPGQYINVYFPELGTPEGKSYSISSLPGAKNFSLSVRTIGEFSNRLASRTKGDIILGSEPYGYFYSESENSPLVLIASGIGIAPFRGMILDQLQKNPDRPIRLFYGSRTLSGAAFREELEELSAKHPNFRLRYFITRDKPEHPLVEYGRMSGEKIFSVLAGWNEEDRKDGKNPAKTEGPEFLICGSIEFTRDLWRSLRTAGAPEESIYTEAFF